MKAVTSYQLGMKCVPRCVAAEVSVKNRVYNFYVYIPLIISYNVTCKYVLTHILSSGDTFC
jgi:hypothetical protein